MAHNVFLDLGLRVHQENELARVCTEGKTLDNSWRMLQHSLYTFNENQAAENAVSAINKTLQTRKALDRFHSYDNDAATPNMAMWWSGSVAFRIRNMIWITP